MAGTRFRKESKVDSGGFGTVYRAVRIADNEIVALNEFSGNEFSERDTQRFIREIRIQSKLDHENIVPILASNLTDVPPWFVMPLAKENLRDKLLRKDLHDDRQIALQIFFQILNGMEYAHNNGVIHRDLKPENILFFEDLLGGEVAQISDFGLGKRLFGESILVTSREWLGTAPYMPPEQLNSFRDVD
jgi:serine/threonine protein kinase